MAICFLDWLASWAKSATILFHLRFFIHLKARFFLILSSLFILRFTILQFWRLSVRKITNNYKVSQVLVVFVEEWLLRRRDVIRVAQYRFHALMRHWLLLLFVVFVAEIGALFVNYDHIFGQVVILLVALLVFRALERASEQLVVRQFVECVHWHLWRHGRVVYFYDQVFIGYAAVYFLNLITFIFI